MDYTAALIFILPAYFANSVPVIFGGGEKVDFGRKLFDGKRVFGDGKTWRGMVSGIAFGALAALVLALIDNLFLPQLAFREKVLAGLLLSCGTMAGDLLGSFLKRRLNISNGAQHEFFDQLLFLGVALAFISPFYVPSLEIAVFLVLVTYVLHKFANWMAHRFKLKKVPW